MVRKEEIREEETFSHMVQPSNNNNGSSDMDSLEDMLRKVLLRFTSIIFNFTMYVKSACENFVFITCFFIALFFRI